MQRARRGHLFEWFRPICILFALSLVAACSSFDTALLSDETIASVGPRQQHSYKSGGRNVRIEMIKGEGQGPLPAVVMLHGASGIGSGHLIYPHGQAIADRGMHAFVIHYYDGLPPRVGSPSSAALHDTRDKIIRDGIAWISARPDVDNSRIALMGLSLGGFHAVGLGARDDRIAAVVNMMGAMPHSISLNSIEHMPPMLIMHGGRDRVVPLSRAFSLAKALDRVGSPYEMKVYRSEGHNFNGAAHSDSVRLAADFLDRTLNGRENVAQLTR